MWTPLREDQHVEGKNHAKQRKVYAKFMGAVGNGLRLWGGEETLRCGVLKKLWLVEHFHDRHHTLII